MSKLDVPIAFLRFHSFLTVFYFWHKTYVAKFKKAPMYVLAKALSPVAASAVLVSFEFINMEEENRLDLLFALANFDLEHLIFDILSQLSALDLRCCQLVSSSWSFYAFISSV